MRLTKKKKEVIEGFAISSELTAFNQFTWESGKTIDNDFIMPFIVKNKRIGYDKKITIIISD